ncbi:DUF2203 domain-containing protein [Paenibacillus hexagrammi]|uniref:DUF2203 domain-containing protein n=1 Tax=Paenibacillus hexagrammi TaxID=2908839 RepID=A0ABY3SK70_9BACL|nr:DUF2203 domain-containing protein [Paenibacillus sp. YPD9-1]UJF34447.1 DUF2203 domain-containing protein [Paenibacillus sp. YPD9-1]
MSIKYFSLQEANALIPEMDRQLQAIQALKKQFDMKYSELRRSKELHAGIQGSNGEDLFFVQEAELEFIQIEARSLIQSFQLQGVELKDIDTGLIDFPAMIDGEEVLLCWKQGEDAIRYYHGVHDGFAGRKPITDQGTSDDHE